MSIQPLLELNNNIARQSSMRSGVSIVMLVLGLTVPNAATAEPFTFVALGDMPYEPLRDNHRFDRLIDAVNDLASAFTLHVGDTKRGSTSCTQSRSLLAGE